MTFELPGRPSAPRRYAVALAAVALAGCSPFGQLAARDEMPADPPASPPVAAPPACPAAGARGPAPVDALLAYHSALRGYTGFDRLRAQALAAPGGHAFARLCQAMVLSRPGGQADLTRARALLDAVLAGEDEDALAVRQLARLLADNVGERQRLGRLIERLEARLAASEQARATLQEKLDALTEIERSLPTRPTPDSSLPPPAEPVPPRRESQ
ncbi:hypothetical protein E6C76_00795 [Pseudothauera nasutitermitis]|uniref:Permease n=1 Tax=Pseudothauera nasutitermitis TaxID=2565930 RepID=A0A4V3WCF5_9RHOO|nr:hypothetical protein [Pseudothauera nasutitermitis]THF66964.1 hypothetical protein E6C76_00795 [Pseudothauera nasutitermitis]